MNPYLPRIVALAAVLIASVLHAATIPYTENFDDDALGTSTPSEPAPESGTFGIAGGTWAVVGGAGAISGQSYNVTNLSGNTSYGAGISFAGVLGGAASSASDFTFSSQVQFNTGTTSVGTGSNVVTAGLGFLGTSSTFGTGYFVDINSSSGLIRFVRNGTPTPDLGSSLDAGTVAIDEVYTLTVTGLYIDTNADTINDALQLSATVSGGGLSGSISYTDPAPVTTGTIFGYRLRNTTASADSDVDFDNYSLVIPEPASAVLLVASAGFLGLYRRHRRAGD